MVFSERLLHYQRVNNYIYDGLNHWDSGTTSKPEMEYMAICIMVKV